ncbi:MAG: hypothetical protein KDC35_21480 [Acidobacteria bacterium]|nr:hypothetical protein [Acidobacteriota bacterium]
MTPEAQRLISAHEIDTEHFHLETVLAGLCYANIFNFPVRVNELKSYLPLERLTTDQIQQVLDLLVMQKRAYVQDGFYSLHQCPELVAQRKSRENTSASKWVSAVPALQKLLAFGFIRAAVLTGSVAANNAHKSADIDLLLVMDHRRMWLGFAVIRLWARMQKQCHPCPNYVIGDNQMKLLYPGYFTAVEFALAKPIKSVERIHEIQTHNAWLRQWTPSARSLWDKAESLPQDRRWYHRLIDWVVDSPVGALLNRLEFKRISWRTRGLYQPNPYIFKPHSPHRSIHIHQALFEQLSSLGIDDSDLGKHLNQSLSFLVAEAERWDSVQGSDRQAHSKRHWQ